MVTLETNWKKSIANKDVLASLTCPNTSSSTEKVKSNPKSVISLSLIHCKLWWNSASKDSRSLSAGALDGDHFKVFNGSIFGHILCKSCNKIIVQCTAKILTLSIRLCRMVSWKKRPKDTDAPMPNQSHDLQIWTWKSYQNLNKIPPFHVSLNY